MGKFLLECALFAVILFQIHLLAMRGQATEDSEASPPPATESLHQEAYFSMQPQQQAAAFVSAAADPFTMQQAAQREAERIIRTGDVESFQQQLEDNRVLLRLMGYSY